jgi:hypothetical protein
MTGQRQTNEATRFIIWAAYGLAVMVAGYFVGMTLK